MLNSATHILINICTIALSLEQRGSYRKSSPVQKGAMTEFWRHKIPPRKWSDHLWSCLGGGSKKEQREKEKHDPQSSFRFWPRFNVLRALYTCNMFVEGIAQIGKRVRQCAGHGKFPPERAPQSRPESSSIHSKSGKVCGMCLKNLWKKLVNLYDKIFRQICVIYQNPENLAFLNEKTQCLYVSKMYALHEYN